MSSTNLCLIILSLIVDSNGDACAPWIQYRRYATPYAAVAARTVQLRIVLSKLICSAVQHKHHFEGKYFTIFIEFWLK